MVDNSSTGCVKTIIHTYALTTVGLNERMVIGLFANEAVP